MNKGDYDDLVAAFQDSLERAFKVLDRGFTEVTNDFYKTNGTNTVFNTEGPSLTRQEFAEDCDINVIMKRFEVTGQLPMNGLQPLYVDYTSKPSTLMEALQVLSDAEAAFMRLPATVRREFDNDPVRFVDFAENPDNLAKLQEWDLAPKPAPEPAAPAPQAPAEPAPGTAGSSSSSSPQAS